MVRGHLFEQLPSVPNGEILLLGHTTMSHHIAAGWIFYQQGRTISFSLFGQVHTPGAKEILGHFQIGRYHRLLFLLHHHLILPLFTTTSSSPRSLLLHPLPPPSSHPLPLSPPPPPLLPLLLPPLHCLPNLNSQWEVPWQGELLHTAQ